MAEVLPRRIVCPHAFPPSQQLAVNLSPMKIPSLLNSMQALRGLGRRSLAALIACSALAAVSTTASAGTGFTGPFNLIAPDGSFFANGWRSENFGLNPFT